MNILPPFFSVLNNFSANPNGTKEPDEKNALALSVDVGGHILRTCETANDCPLPKYKHFFLTNHILQAAVVHHLLLF